MSDITTADTERIIYGTMPLYAVIDQLQPADFESETGKNIARKIRKSIGLVLLDIMENDLDAAVPAEIRKRVEAL